MLTSPSLLGSPGDRCCCILVTFDVARSGPFPSWTIKMSSLCNMHFRQSTWHLYVVPRIRESIAAASHSRALRVRSLGSEKPVRERTSSSRVRRCVSSCGDVLLPLQPDFCFSARLVGKLYVLRVPQGCLEQPRTSPSRFRLPYAPAGRCGIVTQGQGGSAVDASFRGCLASASRCEGPVAGVLLLAPYH